MFAGGRRRSSNIRAMQLFHELKQQFPTVPDHIVTACITEYTNRSNLEGSSDGDDFAFREVLEAAAALSSIENQELMGRTLTKPANSTVSLKEPSLPATEKTKLPQAASRSEMNESDNDFNRNVVKPRVFYSSESETVRVSNPNSEKKIQPQRPNHLNIKAQTASGVVDPGGGFNKIQTSERCFDLQKLLSIDNLNVKPPRSPLSAKRFASAKNSPTRTEPRSSPLTSPDVARAPSDCASASMTNSDNASQNGGFKRPETVETPTQTTETLMGTGNVNLSLNVNCQMDLVQSPTVPKHSTVVQLTPQLPWCQEPMSQRSYTSVNLTLRPPSTEPQPPIDITSQNSSLTYSTSSFDPQKGLQSRLQITVGPGGGSVSSLRTRPRSSYHPQTQNEQTVPVRAGSLPDLATKSTSPVISRQQARIERLRIELITEKGRLVAMQEEVTSLEKPNFITCKVDAEIEKQLQKEIRHLRGQCERLTYEVDRQSESRVPLGETNEEFYRNIYTGQRGPFVLGSSNQRHTHYRGIPAHQQEEHHQQVEFDGPKWNCHMCTFQNHPLLDKCEQCEMPRILHGMKCEPPNPCLAFGMIRPLGEGGPYSPNHIFINNNSPDLSLSNTDLGRTPEIQRALSRNQLLTSQDSNDSTSSFL